MFRNFQLKQTKDAGIITGYAWDLPSPDKVVCIIHGLGELAERYDRMNAYFQKANIASVSMDLRGHGRSGGKRGHAAPRKEILADVDSLLEYAKSSYSGVPIILYGHSLGGNIVLDYRARGTNNGEPAAYVISAPWLVLKNPPSSGVKALAGLLSKVIPSWSIKSSIDEKDLGHPDMVRPYRQNPLVHDRISALAAVEALDIGEALANGSYPENGGAAGIPFLLMHGTGDKVCDYNGSVRFFSENPDNGTFIPWEGLYHEIHNGNSENPGEEVIQRMVRWIQELPV